MSNYEEKIPIFFTVDDAYVPFLAVALQSLIDNSSEENFYLNCDLRDFIYNIIYRIILKIPLL